jgi:hypothetical protein
MPIYDMFAYLISKLGEPEDAVMVSDEENARYAHRVPPALLSFWRNHGRGSYMNGAFWICDPAPFDPLLAQLFKGDPEFDASYMTVVAYSSTGRIIIFDQVKKNISVILMSATVHCPPASSFQYEETKEWFPDNYIVGIAIEQMQDYGQSLHNEATARYGRLKAGEFFALFPALPLGGAESIDNIRKVGIVENFAIMLELTPFTLERLTPPEPPAFPYGRIVPVRRIGPQ